MYVSRRVWLLVLLHSSYMRDFREAVQLMCLCFLICDIGVLDDNVEGPFLYSVPQIIDVEQNVDWLFVV